MAGSWNLKFILFYGDNLWTVALKQMKFGAMKDHGHAYKFFWIIIFFVGTSEYGGGGILKLLSWIQNMHQSTWDYAIFHGDIYLKDEQLLIRSLLQETKNTNVVGGWKLKFTFCFMETAHELLHLDSWSFVLWEVMNIPTSFIWIIIFLDRAFEYGGSSKFWGYVGTNAEPLRRIL
jgi:hypothetical protein